MQASSTAPSRRTWYAAAALLLILLCEIAFSTRQESPSWDEGDHIFSGYENWKNREYSLNPEHPPLVKLIAALPLLPIDLKTAPRQGRFFKSEAYYGGRELLFRNGPRYSADTLLFRVHMAVSVFALLLACLIFLAGQEMFGPAAGLIAMTLFVFDPTILTNAPFVTTDTAAATFFFASVYALYRYIKAPSAGRILTAGLVFGLALASKHSAIMLLPIALLLAAGQLAGCWRTSRENIAKEARRLAAALAVMAATAIFVLWAVYSFRFAMHPFGVNMPPLAQQAAKLHHIPAQVILFFARFHLLPESYLYGLVDVQRVAEGMPTYLLGKLYAHGQWFYFPIALSLKWSIGVLGLLALSLYAFLTGRIHKPREVFFLALPAVFYLAVAMYEPLNIGVRHVLPIFPFVFSLAAAGAYTLVHQKRLLLYPIAALLLWHCVDSLRMFPNYMPYANALWGGPTNTHNILSDSATDWGQQLRWTRQYIDAHHIKDCWFAYFPAPNLLPADYGIPCKLLPTVDTYELELPVPATIHGPILISLSDLNGFEYGTKLRNPYQSFFERPPDDIIANGIAVYNGTYTDPRLTAYLPVQQAKKFLDDVDGEDDLSIREQGIADSLKAARQALAIDPANFDGQLALADALHAEHSDAEARQYYNQALAVTTQMEPTSRQHWRPEIEERLAALKP